MLYPDKKSLQAQDLSRQKLLKASYDFSSSFLLTLAHHEQPLCCEEVVRIVPGKRLVAFGQWNNREVVAKIFFSRQAKQHQQRDLKGAQALMAAKIPSPALLHIDTNQDRSMQILIFERIANAQSLESFWQTKKNFSDSENILHVLAIELATQHVLGLVQEDLHLKNFLVANDKIYTLDGASIQDHEGALSKKQSLENLALLFSQLGIHTQPLQQRLFQSYVKARSWLVEKADVNFLQKSIQHWNRSRWHYYSRKIFRSSTQFAKTRNLTRYSIHDRQYTSPSFQKFLADPDAFLKHADALTLKNGRTSTVVNIQIDGRALVVKRYNIKNFWHGLIKMIKPSRAQTSWRLAHQLQFVGINTAKPVAFIEKRFLGLRRKSYFVMEYIEGTRADHFFNTPAHDSVTCALVAKKIIALFFNLARLRLSHGDLKITNILLNTHLDPALIDLDSMREHYSSLSLWHRFRKDMQRFLENWREEPSLQQVFQNLINEIQ